MKFLLDTHIWVWSLQNPKRLRPKVAKALVSPSAELWLSPISLWEVAVWIEAGRLELRGFSSPRQWIEAALSKVPMREAVLNGQIAMESRELRLKHDDPADRFIAATAAVCELTLVTSDARLLAGKGYKTLANQE
jgi:PIN domain nuclease of toxin-antitoxin system